MPARDTGVGQAELRVLATADDVRAFAQLVGAAAAVVELQRDVRTDGTVATAVAALLSVVGLGVAGTRAAVTRVAIATLGRGWP